MVMPTMQAFAMPSFGFNPLQQLQSINGKLSPMQALVVKPRTK